jgi:integral membrane protein
MLQLFTTALGKLRIVGFIEGVSYLILLFIAMPLKYIWGDPSAVRTYGSVHGLFFILFMVFLFQSKAEYGWSTKKAGLLVLLSMIPFGNFYADWKYLRSPNA